MVSTTSQTTVQQDPPDSTMLYRLARDGDWDGLVSLVESTKDVSCLYEEKNRQDQIIGSDYSKKTSLLHVVCHNASVTPRVISAIVSKDVNITKSRSWLGQTPLHVACTLGGARSCIIQELVQAQPETTNMLDYEQSRPLDAVCHKLIMKEERARYSQADEDSVADVWQSCRLLMQANFPLEESPMIHLCLKMSDCPVMLWKRALERYRDDLHTPDEKHGNLPLHIAASIPHGDEDVDNDHFYEVLMLHPQAASVWNKNKQLPFHLAIRSGRGLKTGLSALLVAHPAALESLDLDTSLYPLILSKFSGITTEGNDSSASRVPAGQIPDLRVVYGMLRAKPDLVLLARPNVAS